MRRPIVVTLNAHGTSCPVPDERKIRFRRGHFKLSNTTLAFWNIQLSWFSRLSWLSWFSRFSGFSFLFLRLAFSFSSFFRFSSYFIFGLFLSSSLLSFSPSLTTIFSFLFGLLLGFRNRLAHENDLFYLFIFHVVEFRYLIIKYINFFKSF